MERALRAVGTEAETGEPLCYFYLIVSSTGYQGSHKDRKDVHTCDTIDLLNPALSLARIWWHLRLHRRPQFLIADANISVQGLKKKFTLRGGVRGASIALCAVNVTGGGLAYVFGKREKEAE